MIEEYLLLNCNLTEGHLQGLDVILINIVSFNDEINEYIQDGYEPYGNPLLNDGILIQAIVKYKDKSQKIYEEIIKGAI